MTYFRDFSPEENSALHRGRAQGEAQGYEEGLRKGVAAGEQHGYAQGHKVGWNEATAVANVEIAKSNDTVHELLRKQQMLNDTLASMQEQLLKLQGRVGELQSENDELRSGRTDGAAGRVHDELKRLADSMVEANKVLQGRVRELEGALREKTLEAEQLHARCQRNAVFIDAARRTLDALVSTDDEHARRARALFVDSYSVPLRSMLASGRLDEPLESDPVFEKEMPRTHALLVKILNGHNADRNAEKDQFREDQPMELEDAHM